MSDEKDEELIDARQEPDDDGVEQQFDRFVLDANAADENNYARHVTIQEEDENLQTLTEESTESGQNETLTTDDLSKKSKDHVVKFAVVISIAIPTGVLITTTNLHNSALFLTNAANS